MSLGTCHSRAGPLRPHRRHSRGCSACQCASLKQRRRRERVCTFCCHLCPFDLTPTEGVQLGHGFSVCWWVCVCVCVFVWEGERKREKEREGERKRERESNINIKYSHPRLYWCLHKFTTRIYMYKDDVIPITQNESWVISSYIFYSQCSVCSVTKLSWGVVGGRGRGGVGGNHHPITACSPSLPKQWSKQ